MGHSRKTRLSEQVIVLTGASSGIGRMTAQELARAGASIVLAARNEEALREVECEVNALGGRAVVVVADVSKPADLQRLADEAITAFGRIDTWINNAGVDQWARFTDHTVQEIDQIIGTNLLGPMYGARAAIARMRAGTIINVGSVESERAMPLQSAYAASKHGVKGFSDALRMELEHDRVPIDIVLIMPTFIDTPLYEHAGAKLGGAEPRPVPPVYSPRAVAEAIVYSCEHPRPEIVVGGSGKLFTLLDKVAPRLLERLMVRSAFRLQTSRKAKSVPSNLFAPSDGYRVRGGYRRFRRSLYTRYVEQHPFVQRALVGSVVIGIAMAALRRRSPSPAASG
jgi:NAD(P)-dependent dehydrogenase (short-subunit alcohol dehydrogenase family)